ncbi:MAG: hypothetical protein HY390_07495 [Deltaproteobacteria bacterium]|nr:hypothetical protein [Deltaproteobacteria bacterium]
MKKVIVAHRGLSNHYPENTLIAFQKAFQTKANFIECDVYLSKDGVPVVIHDRDLKRTTTGTGYVDEQPLSELKSYSAGYPQKFGKKFSDEKIPVLSEVLDLVANHSIGILIEIKAWGPPYKSKSAASYNAKVGPVVYEYVLKKYSKLKDRMVFISFDQAILQSIRQLDASIRLGPIFFELPAHGSMADVALHLKTDLVIFNKTLLKMPSAFDKTNRVWHIVYTVLPSEFEQMERYDELTGFATNDADLAGC